jgi:hypothetical protein
MVNIGNSMRNFTLNIVAALSLQNLLRVDDITTHQTINSRSHIQQSADYICPKFCTSPT